MQWKWFVYIIECADGSYYTEMTWRLDKRWEQHISGFGSKYTGRKKVVRLVYAEEYESFQEAKNRELQIKKWSRIKKEKLIKGEWSKW